MPIGSIEAMKFPMGYGSQRERVQIETDRRQEPREEVLTSTLQNILPGSKVFLSHQLIKMLKLVKIARIRLEFMVFYANFNLFYPMQLLKELMV